MRRRNKREPNLSESTGKVGHQVPANQPKPLVPLYSDELPAVRRAPEPPRPAAPPAPQRPAPQRSATLGSAAPVVPRSAVRVPSYVPEDSVAGRLELETQPESPDAPAEKTTLAKAPEPLGTVVLTIGLPGSGKTTWFKRRSVTPLSSDMLRQLILDDELDQRFQGLVFSSLRTLLRARMIARMPASYVDATNLSPHERRQWIKMAQSFGYEVQAVFFDVPLEVCLERDAKRERPVGEEVLRKMSERLKPPAFDEGFAKITVVRVKA